MQSELDPLLPLVVMFALGVCLGVTLQRPFKRTGYGNRRNKWLDKRSAISVHRTRLYGFKPSKLDAVDQLRTVMAADFSSRPLLNTSEARVFAELTKIVARCNPNWRVMAQVSLGEILLSKDRDAFSCVNSKRVDMLLVDEHNCPRHAIEYQGGGHYQGTAAARDAVKKEALRRADIGYHEVVAGHTTPTELRMLVERLVTKADAQQDS